MEVFLPVLVAPQLQYLMGMLFGNEDRVVTDLSVAIPSRAAAELEQTESTFENYCVLTKSFLGKETII